MKKIKIKSAPKDKVLSGPNHRCEKNLNLSESYYSLDMTFIERAG